ncbi:MAG: tetratricopeptide repeat protein [Steroidobacteraceae bacterium]|jgi:tetratricopeptide (TPR) repeat protein
MRTALYVLPTCLLALSVPAAWASGGGMSSMPSPSMPRLATPEQQARDLYYDGVRAAKKADSAQADADKATDAGKKDKAARDAHDRYATALGKFQQAVQLNPQMPEAWNYVGYTSRRLGHYDDALAAYEKALSLKPGYPDAIEYRGEAYLGVNRPADAKQAYLDLFAGNRALADKLLSAMKAWVAAQRAAPAGSAATGADELDQWIQERSQIAAQTAALTRAGTAAAWR